jgi:pyrroloquinoline quinone (PQQ) biosynthesis protein C
MDMTFKLKLMALIDELPMLKHPWFQGIINHQFTKEQIIAGEFQHYLRVRRNAEIFGAVVINAANEGDYETLEIARKNYKDEMLSEKTHADLMFQFLEDLGYKKEFADNIEPMPGTMAAVEMLTSGTRNMTGIEGIAIFSLPEYQNGGTTGVAAQVYNALTQHYGFSEYAAETFRVHAHDDVAHGSTQIELLVKRANKKPELQEKILRASRFGINAFNFEWDGHYQAATKRRSFWQGPDIEL